MLEANPSVTRYCERPSWPAESGPRPAIDFWVLRENQPTWLMLENLQVSPNEGACPPQDGVAQCVTLNDLDTHRVWIQNWLSLLPYLSATNSLNLDHLGKQVVEFFTHESSLAEAERHFARDDAVLVRTAIIAQLHAGRLYSTDLLTRVWDADTRIVRIDVSPGTHHAPQ
jgi:hypothetical protein